MNNYGYYRPGLPFVVKNLIIINAIVFVATLFAQQFMYQTFSLFYFTSPFFKPFQLITYMFMHGGRTIGEGRNFSCSTWSAA